MNIASDAKEQADRRERIATAVLTSLIVNGTVRPINRIAVALEYAEELIAALDGRPGSAIDNDSVPRMLP